MKCRILSGSQYTVFMHSKVHSHVHSANFPIYPTHLCDETESTETESTY